MMVFAGILIILIVFYVYTFIKQKKRSRKQSNAVEEFKRTYRKHNLQKKSEEFDGYTKFITKYNSSVDFVEKEDFIKEATETDEQEKPKKKQLQF